MSFIVYVLLCEHEKIYVGRCRRDRLHERLNEHQSGSACTFTHMYPIQDVLQVSLSDNSRDEDNIVMEFMENNGINNVRGGTFSSIHLPEYQIRTLIDQLRHNRGACIRCGKIGHYIDTCPEHSSTNINVSRQNTTIVASHLDSRDAFKKKNENCQTFYETLMQSTNHESRKA